MGFESWFIHARGVFSVIKRRARARGCCCQPAGQFEERLCSMMLQSQKVAEVGLFVTQRRARGDVINRLTKQSVGLIRDMKPDYFPSLG